MHKLIERFDLKIKSHLEIGGMKTNFDENLVNNSHILIGTPGRLYELFYSQKEFVLNLKELEFLIMDEADRLITSN